MARDAAALAVEIGVPAGVCQMASGTTEGWVTVVATPAHLADEAMRCGTPAGLSIFTGQHKLVRPS